MRDGDVVFVRTHHPRAHLGRPGVFGPRVDGVGDVLGKAAHFHNPTLATRRVDVFDLERDVGEGGIGKLDSWLSPDGNGAPVKRVVDGEDLRLTVANDGQPAKVLTLEEGEAFVFANLLELAILGG